MNLDKFFEDIMQHKEISGTSLIITFYGDFLWLSGGGIWLGSLIKCMDDVGLSQRVVRSSVYRLNKDNWLTVTKQGRKSYYFLSPDRYSETEAANRKIYNLETHYWNKRWNLIHTDLGTNNQSKEEVRYLQCLGFGLVDKDFFIQPDMQQFNLKDIENVSKLIPSARIFQHAELSYINENELFSMVDQSWDLNKIRGLYEDFIEMFAPLANFLETKRLDDLNPRECFKLRLLLIHFYRKIILKDPLLPEQLLSKDWPKPTAQSIATSIYRKIHYKAFLYVQQFGETPTGALPAPIPKYYNRFKGLSD